MPNGLEFLGNGPEVVYYKCDRCGERFSWVPCPELPELPFRCEECDSKLIDYGVSIEASLKSFVHDEGLSSAATISMRWVLALEDFLEMGDEEEQKAALLLLERVQKAQKAVGLA